MLMTDNKGKIGGAKSIRDITAFHLEAERETKGMALLFSGIIGIDGFDDSHVDLKSHGGRISVNGKKLQINIYEKNRVEIVGKVEGIIFKYGKN